MLLFYISAGYVLEGSMSPLKRRIPNVKSLSRAVLIAALLIITLGACDSDSADDRSGARSSDTATTSDPPDPSDEAEVRGLLDQVNDAWARGDARGYAAAHTPDADLIDFRGIHAVGRQEMIDLLQPAFDGILKDTRVEARITDLRFLTPTVAIFHTEGRIVPTGEDSVQTFVATKASGSWLIAAFQNTRKLDLGN